jgi:hypothetical protein
MAFSIRPDITNFIWRVIIHNDEENHAFRGTPSQRFDEVGDPGNRGLYCRLDGTGSGPNLREDVAHPRCNAFSDFGHQPEGHFEGQKDCHGDQVEVVVHGCGGEGTMEVGALSDMAERCQSVGDGGADVGAHHHRDGSFDGQNS